MGLCHFLSRRTSSNRLRYVVEDEKMARLEEAERELESVKDRAARATQILRDRNRRNHWRESIERMIQGA